MPSETNSKKNALRPSGCAPSGPVKVTVKWTITGSQPSLQPWTRSGSAHRFWVLGISSLCSWPLSDGEMKLPTTAMADFFPRCDVRAASGKHSPVHEAPEPSPQQALPGTAAQPPCSGDTPPELASSEHRGHQIRSPAGISLGADPRGVPANSSWALSPPAEQLPVGPRGQQV